MDRSHAIQRKRNKVKKMIRLNLQYAFISYSVLKITANSVQSTTTKIFNPSPQHKKKRFLNEMFQTVSASYGYILQKYITSVYSIQVFYFINNDKRNIIYMKQPIECQSFLMSILSHSTICVIIYKYMRSAASTDRLFLVNLARSSIDHFFVFYIFFILL